MCGKGGRSSGSLFLCLWQKFTSTGCQPPTVLKRTICSKIDCVSRVAVETEAALTTRSSFGVSISISPPPLPFYYRSSRSQVDAFEPSSCPRGMGSHPRRRKLNGGVRRNCCQRSVDTASQGHDPHGAQHRYREGSRPRGARGWRCRWLGGKRSDHVLVSCRAGTLFMHDRGSSLGELSCGLSTAH